MKIKTKLALGVGFLFVLIIVMSAIGAIYITTLKTDTENILISNYNSLEFSRNMLRAIDDTTKTSQLEFEKNLNGQLHNISEIGEQELTDTLHTSYQIYSTQQHASHLKTRIRNSIFEIMDMNMQAIQRKSEQAKSTANTAVIWILVSGTLCFLMAFTLLVNLPSNIANPIQTITKSIQQIATKNYSERVHFESHSEFGDLAKSFNSMASKLEEYNNSNLAKLMIEKKRIETLINNMVDPVIGLDEENTILFANEEALQVTGLKLTQLIGLNINDVAQKNDLIRSLIKDINVYETPQKTTTAQPLKIFCNGKDGYFEKEIVNISILPTGEQEKKRIGRVIILRNVTAYKELDFAKTNFIATVSHEFKTPISSIKMSIQLLQNHNIGSLNEEQHKLVDSIYDDANRLLKFTGELLNMTQIENGHILLAITSCNPKDIIDYAVQTTKTQAEQKQIKLTVSLPQALPLIHADAEKTAWVLTNLLSNAIRYSPPQSSVLISCTNDNNDLQIHIKDHGIGIAKEYHTRIFERYFRVPGGVNEGTGLGLAISKEFIEAQGGQIKLESEIGSGSTFTVSLKI